MELAVLGPVELLGAPGGELNGTMVRRLAAALALSPRGLPFDGLVDALWGEEPPPSARKTLQGFVHRLRRSLGPDALVRTADGYRLEADLVELDVEAFDRDLDEAAALVAAGRGEEALVRADAALRRWRGTPFVELGDLPPAVAERARLEERLRLGEELRAQLALGRGDAGAVVGDLEAMVACAPLRERRWALLIEAMRRSGRPAEALRAYERARATFVEAVGAEPGAELRAAYQELLHETDGRPALDVVPSTLPAPRSSFVGRAADLAGLAPLVDRERLVTLVGTGGSGKTRLAVELARRWCDRNRRPAWFADLTALTDASSLAAAVDAAVSGQREVDVGAAPGRALAAARGLLVIDNAEHLLDAVGELVDGLLDRAPGLHLLVTSREPLGVDGEVHRSVEPLSEGDAVSLFVARARATRPGFPEGAEHLTEVEALCGELDRLPLALELAAAHVGVLSPAELRLRLARHGDLPGFGAGSRPRRPGPGRARWSSLGAALRWSTDSLTPPQRAAFQRLAVLPDSFSLAAARSVCDVDEDGALEVLDALVRKSLLESVPAARSVRFRMLDTVRRHAASGLAKDPQASAAARDGLLRWAVEEAERYRQRADAAGHRVAMDAVEQEQHNMRAALDWAAAGGGAVQGVAVLCGTEDWWRAAGHTAEGWERLRTLLDRAVDHEVPERTWLHGVTCLVVFAAFLDDAAEAVSAELLRRAERRLEHVADPELRLRLATELAWVRLDLSDAGGGARFVELLDESRRLGGLMESSLLHYLAIWQLTHDEPGAALTSARACAISAAAAGNDVSQAHSAELLGMVLTTNACPDEARAHLGDALDAMVAVDHLGCVVHCIESIAWWAASVERLEEARRLLGHADGLRRSLRRSRFSVERYAYEAAIARCGEPTLPAGGDLIGDALALAAELLAPTGPAGPDAGASGAPRAAAPERRLSRPAWMHSPPSAGAPG